VNEFINSIHGYPLYVTLDAAFFDLFAVARSQ